jgi:hypothetical protein
MQASQLGQQAQQFGAGLGKDVGLAGLATGLETAKATGQLGATEQMANLERLKAQAASGGEKQALQQEIDNLAYQQYKEATRLSKSVTRVSIKYSTRYCRCIGFNSGGLRTRSKFSITTRRSRSSRSRFI